MDLVDGRGIRPNTSIRCFRRQALFHFDVTVMTVIGAKSKSKSSRVMAGGMGLGTEVRVTNQIHPPRQALDNALEVQRAVVLTPQYRT